MNIVSTREVIATATFSKVLLLSSSIILCSELLLWQTPITVPQHFFLFFSPALPPPAGRVPRAPALARYLEAGRSWCPFHQIPPQPHLSCGCRHSEKAGRFFLLSLLSVMPMENEVWRINFSSSFLKNIFFQTYKSMIVKHHYLLIH